MTADRSLAPQFAFVPTNQIVVWRESAGHHHFSSSFKSPLKRSNEEFYLTGITAGMCILCTDQSVDPKVQLSSQGERFIKGHFLNPELLNISIM